MATPFPRPRWFQYRLRTLLLFVLLVSIGMSWFSVKMRRAKKQEAAVRAIQDLGGIVWYDYQVDADGSPKDKPQPPTPEWLRNVLGNDFFSTVVHVCVFGMTDAGLEELKGLPQLRRLIVEGNVTDAGLETLKCLPHLEILSLCETQITNSGLEKLVVS